MKNTSFRCRWTKTSLQRIKQKFIESKTEFLCIRNKEFANLWYEYTAEIQNLADDFLKQSVYGQLYGFYAQGGYVLFVSDNLKHDCTLSTQIRLDFLDYEIKRLSEKKA